MSISDELYKEIIIEHSQNPSHRHAIPNPTVHESAVNRSCGDELELDLLVEDGIIKDIGVTGRGCSISIASGSLMAESVEGMSLQEAAALIGKFKGMLLEGAPVEFPEELEDLKSLEGVKKYPIRVKCATLSWNALEQALKSAMR